MNSCTSQVEYLECIAKTFVEVKTTVACCEPNPEIREPKFAGERKLISSINLTVIKIVTPKSIESEDMIVEDVLTAVGHIELENLIASSFNAKLILSSL